jgi:hypothetical protein
VLHGAVVCLRVDALVVAGGCPGISGASLFVKLLLLGFDPSAMTMSLVFPIEEARSPRLARFVWQDNDASAADDVTGWVARGAVVDGVVRGVAFVVAR